MQIPGNTSPSNPVPLDMAATALERWDSRPLSCFTVWRLGRSSSRKCIGGRRKHFFFWETSKSFAHYFLWLGRVCVCAKIETPFYIPCEEDTLYLLPNCMYLCGSYQFKFTNTINHPPVWTRRRDTSRESWTFSPGFVLLSACLGVNGSLQERKVTGVSRNSPLLGTEDRMGMEVRYCTGAADTEGSATRRKKS